MAKKHPDGRVIRLIRLLRTDENTRQQVFTTDGWKPYSSMDYTGMGGDADWEPVDLEKVVEIISKAGALGKVHPFGDMP